MLVFTIVALISISFVFTLNFILKVVDKVKWGYDLEYAIHEAFLELF